MRVSILAAAVALLAAASAPLSANAHSWIGCTDYRGDVSMYEEAKCYGWPRNYNQYFGSTPKTADGYNLAADMGYNNNNAASQCGVSMTSPISAAYTTTYPMATYEVGGTYCLAHPTKNHASAQCTNQYIPDTLMAIYRSGVNPTADPDQTTFNLNRVKDNYGVHVNGAIDCLGFQRSPKFCSNTGAALATGCITLPSDLPVGMYVFQWLWEFNSAAAGDTYRNCWDVRVVAKGAGSGSGGLTGWDGVVDNLTPSGDTCRKNWAIVGNPPLPGGTPGTPSSGGTTGSSATTASTGAAAAGSTTASSGTTTGTSGTVSSSVLWSGLFNGYTVTTDFDLWSWTTQLGEYKSYIYGNDLMTQKMSDYLSLSASYVNPVDSAFATKGLALSIDGTSSWNDQTMLRTELIANINNQVIQTGKRYFHFSMMQPSSDTALLTTYEHQMVFFESHFCEIKYGIGTSNLQFWANYQLQWSTPFTIGVWQKFAFGVDFDAKTCELWYAGPGASTSLAKVSGPITVSGISPSDWHVGHLRLPLNNVQATAKETVYYSSIFISKDSISTTPVVTANGGGAAGAGGGAGSGTGTLQAGAPHTASSSFVALLLAAAVAAMMA